MNKRYLETINSEGHIVMIGLDNINFVGEYGNKYREVHFADGHSWISVEATIDDFRAAFDNEEAILQQEAATEEEAVVEKGEDQDDASPTDE